jgi:hypothetical protein
VDKVKDTIDLLKSKHHQEAIVAPNYVITQQPQYVVAAMPQYLPQVVAPPTAVAGTPTPQEMPPPPPAVEEKEITVRGQQQQQQHPQIAPALSSVRTRLAAATRLVQRTAGPFCWPLPSCPA